jgi:hypothetical protein
MRYTCLFVPGVTLVYSQGRVPYEQPLTLASAMKRAALGQRVLGCVSRCGPVARDGSSRPCRCQDI